jgi:hypothetical protein
MSEASASSAAFRTLDDWYRGEVWGEAAFFALAGDTPDDANAAKWRRLAALERVTRERIGTAIRQLGGTPPAVEPQADLTRTRIAELAGTPWPDLMCWLERMAADALDAMTRDSHALPEELESTVTWVLDHERALLDFARHELAGDGARSLDRVRALLGTAEPMHR